MDKLVLGDEGVFYSGACEEGKAGAVLLIKFGRIITPNFFTLKTIDKPDSRFHPNSGRIPNHPGSRRALEFRQA